MKQKDVYIYFNDWTYFGNVDHLDRDFSRQ